MFFRRIIADVLLQFFITPVLLIHVRGRDLAMRQIHETTDKRYATIIKGWLKDIMYGVEDHEWGLVVDEEDSE